MANKQQQLLTKMPPGYHDATLPNDGIDWWDFVGEDDGAKQTDVAAERPKKGAQCDASRRCSPGEPLGSLRSDRFRGELPPCRLGRERQTHRPTNPHAEHRAGRARRSVAPVFERASVQHDRS